MFISGVAATILLVLWFVAMIGIPIFVAEISDSRNGYMANMAVVAGGVTCVIALAILFLLIFAARANAHEIEHTHAEEIPSPPPNETIVKCLDEYNPFVHHSLRRREFEILKQCILNADKERQYQDAIRMFMAQKGVQI